MASNLTRRQFGTLAAGGVALALPARFALAQETKLKYGTAFPADHPGTVRIKEAAEAIRKDTGGKVDLQVFPASQLGSEPDMISQTRSGGIDFMSHGRHEPADAGSDRRHQRRGVRVQGLRDGLGGDGRRPRRARARRARPRSTCTRSTRCLDNGYPPHHVVDQADQHARRPEGLQDPRAGHRRCGSRCSRRSARRPTVITFGELYSALQTKVVDGQENPLALISSAKLYEVQKYCSLTGHTWDGHFVFGNAKELRGAAARTCGGHREAPRRRRAEAARGHRAR